MRLTEKKEKYIDELKTNGHIYFVNDIFPYDDCKLTSRSIDKLGRLEDIMEKYGFETIEDLDEYLFNKVPMICKNGKWYKENKDEIR